MRNLMLRPSRFDLAGELNDFFSDFRHWPIWNRQSGYFVPATDIEETDNEFRLVFELPGMDKKDIKISVADNVLTVSGEKEVTIEEQGKNYVRSEIRCGSFSRSFTLPNMVDVGNVSADYRDGLLTVTLRKTEEAKPKLIEVKIK